MELKEYFGLRNDLIENSIDEDGVFSEDTFLYKVLPDLMEVKMIDSDDITFSYVKTSLDGHNLKINGYTINESGERLQVFLINDRATSLNLKDEDLMINLKDYYQILFSESTRFIKSSLKHHLTLHDSDTAGFLVSQLGLSDFMNNIEVIEIFLISPTVTIETRGAVPSVKNMSFKDEEYKTSFTVKRERKEKNILITKKLVDLNFLYDISVSKGYKYALEVNFSDIFDKDIEVLKAADEENFESYLCVLPAEGLASLYRRYSTRLLEKNVRSFLNFRVEANSAMRKTILNNPEYFIAYNNGLTITASDKEIIHENGKIYLRSLTDFQIVNGGQTTASIFFSKKDNLDISKINLMAKINIAKQISDEEMNELISNISLYSNTQSKVSKVDLKSRNPQIDRIKAMSNSIVTPLGYKWFFEKARGEFSTMVRLAGGNKRRIEKEYPRNRRLTKVELGKYYTAWGDYPWLVKKGGEKVFRSFIEKITGEGSGKKQMEINREFYENLIAKAILFRKLEIIHGTRNNAIGQLRSAAVPYSISVLFNMFGGTEKRNAKFNLNSIWKSQDLPDDLSYFMKDLMILLYQLIKKYATSDDLGENTKKEELWAKIKKSSEIKSYTSSVDAKKIKEKYHSIEIQKIVYPEIDFSNIIMAVDLLSKGKTFYTELQARIMRHTGVSSYKPKTYDRYLENMFPSKGAPQEVTALQLNFFNTLFKNVRENSPELLDNLPLSKENYPLKISLDEIIVIYNSSVSENKDIVSEFNRHSEIASHKKSLYSSSIATIGRKLENGQTPSLLELKQSSNYFMREVKTGPSGLAKNPVNQYSDTYIKLVCRQDIERTPSVSIEAMEKFFRLNLENGEAKILNLLIKGKKYGVELNKRNTRNEYRFFLNRIKNDINYEIDDILVFNRVRNDFQLIVLRKNENNDFSEYSNALSKLNEKLHLVN